MSGEGTQNTLQDPPVTPGRITLRFSGPSIITEIRQREMKGGEAGEWLFEAGGSSAAFLEPCHAASLSPRPSTLSSPVRQQARPARAAPHTGPTPAMGHYSAGAQRVPELQHLTPLSHKTIVWNLPECLKNDGI